VGLWSRAATAVVAAVACGGVTGVAVFDAAWSVATRRVRARRVAWISRSSWSTEARSPLLLIKTLEMLISFETYVGRLCSVVGGPYLVRTSG
jgi:hypothetical protein